MTKAEKEALWSEDRALQQLLAGARGGADALAAHLLSPAAAALSAQQLSALVAGLTGSVQVRMGRLTLLLHPRHPRLLSGSASQGSAHSSARLDMKLACC